MGRIVLKRLKIILYAWELSVKSYSVDVGFPGCHVSTLIDELFLFYRVSWLDRKLSSPTAGRSMVEQVRAIGKRMPISQSGMIQTEDWQARLIIVAWPIVRLGTCSLAIKKRVKNPIYTVCPILCFGQRGFTSILHFTYIMDLFISSSIA